MRKEWREPSRSCVAQPETLLGCGDFDAPRLGDRVFVLIRATVVAGVGEQTLGDEAEALDPVPVELHEAEVVETAGPGLDEELLQSFMLGKGQQITHTIYPSIRSEKAHLHS